MRAPARGHFREAAHSTANVEHKFAVQFLWREAGLVAESRFRFTAALVIQLSSTMELPFESEVLGVVAGRHELGHAVDDWKTTATIGTDISCVILAEAFSAQWTAENLENLAGKLRLLTLFRGRGSPVV